MIHEDMVRGPNDPRLKERTQYHDPKYQIYECTWCGDQYLASFHGLPRRGWLLGQTTDRTGERFYGWFCSKRCVAFWLKDREKQQTTEVGVLSW